MCSCVRSPGNILEVFGVLGDAHGKLLVLDLAPLHGRRAREGFGGAALVVQDAVHATGVSRIKVARQWAGHVNQGSPERRIRHAVPNPATQVYSADRRLDRERPRGTVIEN